MEIELNGKVFEYNDDVRFGVIELMRKDPEKLKNIKIFLKEILIPNPTAKEIFNFRESQIRNIIEEYGKFRTQDNIESKKKLGQ